MDFSNVEAPVISSISTNEVVDVNLPKNNDISDLIPKVEETVEVKEETTNTETKDKKINIEELLDKYINDDSVISLYFHNKLYVDYKDRKEIVNDESLNNNLLKVISNNHEEYKEKYYLNILSDNKSLYLKKYKDIDFGDEIKELINKNLIVYGYKNSGKTTVIKNLLSKLNNFKIFVFSKENLLFKEDNIIVFNDFNNIYQILNQNPDYIYINKLDKLFIDYYDLFKSFRVILESEYNTEYLFKDYINVKVEKTDDIKYTIISEELKEKIKEPKKDEEEIDLLVL